MEVVDTALSDVKIIVPQRIGDTRGFFSEVWNARDFAATGINATFVQDNHARSAQKGTLRGLHFQIPPMAQGKLVRVTRGSIFDIAVDIRKGSPTFGRHADAVLSADNWYQLWVPAGFAHGYCTLENDTEVQYKTTNYYSPQHDGGIRWNDPTLKINWPVVLQDAVLSERDRGLPYLGDCDDLFIYDR